VKRLMAATLGVALALAISLPAAGVGAEHCPSGGVKVEANPGTQAAINATILPAGTLVCVKAGEGNSGIVTADGQTTLQGYAPDGKDVSHYVIYEETQPSVTPSPPSPSPSPSASATPSPSPTPTPTPSPTATPSTPTSQPSPTPPLPTGPPTDV
jgi:hypothetical protein